MSALASPRFLLRRPYGKKSDPISEFDFEEFSDAEGLGGMLWGNPAVFVAILLAQSYRKNGAHMKLGSVMQIGGMPYHFVHDSYGDQVQLPCTERNVTQTRAVKVIERGYMPVLTIKGRDEIRLAAFVSLAGKILLGPWTSVPPPEPSPNSTAVVLKVGGAAAAVAAAGDEDGEDGEEGDDGFGLDDDDSFGLGDDDSLGGGDDDDLSSLMGEDDDSGSGDSDLDALLSGDEDGGGDFGIGRSPRRLRRFQ